MPQNSFLHSSLSYGLPDLSSFTAQDLDHLLAAAVSEQAAAWEAIASDEREPSFATVVEPLEDAWAGFARAEGILGTFAGSMGTPEILAVEERWSPRLAEHSASAARNQELAQKLAAVPEEGLDAEQLHVLREWRKDFRSQGVFVPQEDRAELAAIEEELAQLSSRFGAGLLRGASDAALLVEDREELAGLSEAAVAAAARTAEDAGHAGKYLLGQDLFAAPSSLSSLRDADVRARYYADSVNRGRGPARDEGTAETPEILTVGARMAALRDRRAQLFEAQTHAELQLRTTVAGSVQRALGMLEDLVPKALENFSRELESMAEAAGVDRESITAADVPYYLELVAREEYSVDAEALRPYFELDAVLRDGVFWAAEQLYGITFRERTDLPVYRPGVRVWEVLEEDGTGLGLFLGDFFARSTKQGGAWTHDLVPRDGRCGQAPVVVNTLNLTEPAEGSPALLSVDNVRTLFHEFGHALHSLLSSVRYPSVAGTNVPRDFVEYPSQVNEMWMFWPEVVRNYAKHAVTGEPLPQESIDALDASALWGEGFGTAEYLGAALLDLAWHTRGADAPEITTPEGAREFEEQVLAQYGFDALPVSPRYRTGMFKHIFDGGYSARYYSYIFSEMMDAETVEWFRSRGGLTRENGRVFRKKLLSRGNAQDPAQSFRDLLGRDPEIEPLLTRRGLDG